MSHQQTSSTVSSTASTGVKMKTILLIGASKHIGFHILEDIAPNKDNYSLHVLARTQSSSIPNFNGKENITFIQGDAKDPTTIQNTITSIPKLDYIIITVGSSIAFKNLIIPTIADPTLCETAAKVVLEEANKLASPPIIIATSSTGILSTADKLPLLLKPLYKLLLHKAHVDKINMEQTIAEKYKGKWVLIRGALYTDGEKKAKYRVGESEIGYTISRKDVADFIVRECLGSGKWLGKRPVVVY